MEKASFFGITPSKFQNKTISIIETNIKLTLVITVSHIETTNQFQMHLDQVILK